MKTPRLPAEAFKGLSRLAHDANAYVRQFEANQQLRPADWKPPVELEPPKPAPRVPFTPPPKEPIDYSNPRRIKARYHRIDGWRGFSIPGAAVAGASDTGTFSDSPCPSDRVRAEIDRFRDECLKPAGIKSRVRGGGSSNVCCGKIWVVVAVEDHRKAMALANEWLEQHKHDTHYIHDAE